MSRIELCYEIYKSNEFSRWPCENYKIYAINDLSRWPRENCKILKICDISRCPCENCQIYNVHDIRQTLRQICQNSPPFRYANNNTSSKWRCRFTILTEIAKFANFTFFRQNPRGFVTIFLPWLCEEKHILEATLQVCFINEVSRA